METTAEEKLGDYYFEGIHTFIYSVAEIDAIEMDECTWKKISNEGNPSQDKYDLLKEKNSIPFLVNKYLAQDDLNEGQTWFKSKEFWDFVIQNPGENSFCHAKINAFFVRNEKFKTTTLFLNLRFSRKLLEEYEARAGHLKQNTSLFKPWTTDNIIASAFSSYDKNLGAYKEHKWSDMNKSRVTIHSGNPDKYKTGVLYYSLGQLRKLLWKYEASEYFRILQISKIIESTNYKITNLSVFFDNKWNRKIISGLQDTDEGWRYHTDQFAENAVKHCFASRDFCRAFIHGCNSICFRLEDMEMEVTKNAKVNLAGLMDPDLLKFHDIIDETAGLKTGLFSSALRHIEICAYIKKFDMDRSPKRLAESELLARRMELSDAVVLLNKRGISELRLLHDIVANGIGLRERYEKIRVELKEVEDGLKRKSDVTLNTTVMILTIATIVLECLHIIHAHNEGNIDAKRFVLLIAIGGAITTIAIAFLFCWNTLRLQWHDWRRGLDKEEQQIMDQLAKDFTDVGSGLNQCR